MVVDSRSGSGYAGKIEETVIGQIDDGGFIGSSPVFDDQSIGLILQALSHFYFEISGEALFAVGGCVVEDDC